MKPFYRGQSYESEVPSLEVTEAEIAARAYQDQRWKCRTLNEIPVPQSPDHQSPEQLKDQGTTDPTHPRCTGAAPAETAKTLLKLNPEPHREILAAVARIHCSNIRQNLERRLQAAKARGDQSLVQLLEDEQKQLVC